MLARRGLPRQVVEAGGNYAWPVKDNQANLREALVSLFEIEGGETDLKATGDDPRGVETTDKRHGRVEQRRLTTSGMLAGANR